MKKTFLSILASFFMLCSAGASPKVIATIFPIHDWTREIAGDSGIQLTMLFSKGADAHNYQPSVKDIAEISSCDVFIHVGGESDYWVNDVLKNVRNKKMVVVNLMDVMGRNAKVEEHREGMQLSRGHDDDEEELDEHVWLSLRNASLLSGAICDALCSVDSKNASLYRANLKSYVARLSALDGKYEQAVKASAGRTVVFCDRFPFRYLTDDYGIEYYAAFAGCSTETEASFRTVAFLSKKIDELSATNVAVIENSDGKIAKTVIGNSRNKKCGTVVMDSMQSTSPAEIKAGKTYLSAMEKNLEVLKVLLR